MTETGVGSSSRCSSMERTSTERDLVAVGGGEGHRAPLTGHGADGTPRTSEQTRVRRYRYGSTRSSRSNSIGRDAVRRPQEKCLLFVH